MTTLSSMNPIRIRVIPRKTAPRPRTEVQAGKESLSDEDCRFAQSKSRALPNARAHKVAAVMALALASALLTVLSGRLACEPSLVPMGQHVWAQEFAVVLKLSFALTGLYVVIRAIRMDRALHRLAGALENRGREEQPRPLPEDGPSSVARLARTINTTCRQRAEQIRQHLDMQAAFAHDLRTPLTRMGLRCELLLDSTLASAMERDLAEMESLVEDGIEGARTLHGLAEPARRVDADALISSLVEGYREVGYAVGREGIATHSVLASPRALRRVLTNLVDNALRYAGEASLCARTENQRLILTVVDSGPGIPPEDLEKVFAPWYRGPAAMESSTGSGLGLASARRLAKAMRCDLTLQNRQSGGLEARLTLPMFSSSLDCAINGH